MGAWGEGPPRTLQWDEGQGLRDGLSECRGRIWSQWPRQEKETPGRLGPLKTSPLLPSFPPSCLVTQACLTLLQPHGLWPLQAPLQWDSPGKNTEVGCRFLLQGNLPDPGIKSESPALAGGLCTTQPTSEAPFSPVTCQAKQDTAKGWC